MTVKNVHALVIGSGAAGLAAAVRLDSLGVSPVMLCTEGLHMGTSINTGADKQLYRTSGSCGKTPDSPFLAALDAFSAGAVHGDIAYTEAATARRAFDFLANSGVPFAHDEFGDFALTAAGNDNIPRAASSGAHTSRDISLALVRQLKRSGVELCEHRVAVALLTDGFGGERRCTGALFVNTAPADPSDIFEAVYSPNTILACGGPGGFFTESVYPELQTGSIGIAVEAGVAARNLANFRYGLSAVAFRRMLSGSYMQVLPRFVSCEPDGTCEREFLREYFDTLSDMQTAIFLKGRSWAFRSASSEKESLIDLAVYHERNVRHRKVYLDFRRDPDDFHYSALPEAIKKFWTATDSAGASPIERLERLNRPASGAFRGHGFDLAESMLEAAICVQHNCGGIACDISGCSENLPGLYAVGEVNGSLGLEVPPGGALSSGQVWAFRAAEAVAAQKTFPILPESESQIRRIMSRIQKPLLLDWREERFNIRRIMSKACAMVRDVESVDESLSAVRLLVKAHSESGSIGLGARDTAEFLRNGSILSACTAYLISVREDIACGSRGGHIVDSPDGETTHHALPYRRMPEDVSKRGMILETLITETGRENLKWVPVREIPVSGPMFENIWRRYRLREYPRADGKFL